MSVLDILINVLKVFLQPYFLILAGIAAVYMVVRRWWHFRSHAKARAEQVAALTPLASSLGGTVTGPEEATAWSAELQAPMANAVAGFWGRTFQRSKPQFDLALDFQRGPWHVRVTEASVRKAVINGYGVSWEQEHRIEVATNRLAPMKILRLRRITIGGPLSHDRVQEQRFSGWVSERPLTAEREQAEWHPVMLLPPLDEEFAAFGSDLEDTGLNAEALKWLQSRQADMPLPAQYMRLTFEAGLVYAVFPDHIYPDRLMHVVDTIVGLLDRMPNAQPRHPRRPDSVQGA